MAKLSAKSAVILIGGYVLSPDASGYTVDDMAAAVDVTGFGEPQNFTPGLVSGKINLDMYWNNATSQANDALKTVPASTNVTIFPEGYTLGTNSITMPVHHTNWHPQGSPEAAIRAGSVEFFNRGTVVAVEEGWALAHATITNTATGTGVLDPADAAVTAVCGGTLHIWTACAADTYVVKIQHSTNNSTWADLVTFTLNGSAIGSERIAVASGTVNKYRRALATRTGAAGNPFGYSVHFWHA